MSRAHLEHSIGTTDRSKAVPRPIALPDENTYSPDPRYRVLWGRVAL
ncbi:MAG: hypothetical protein ACI4TJ_04760 [Candidatus Cryptobacteroides sp.]